MRVVRTVVARLRGAGRGGRAALLLGGALVASVAVADGPSAVGAVLAGAWVGAALARARGAAPGRSGRSEPVDPADERGRTERERARLARELHDGLGGSLAALVLQAERAAQRLAGGPGASEVEQLRATAREALEDLRRSMGLMRRDFDLHGAMRARVDAATRDPFGSGPGSARFTIRGRVRRLPSEMQLSLYRALQELVTNVERHARASRLNAELSYRGDRVRLVVRDDGRGMDPGWAGAARAGGLANLRARVARFDGHVRVASRPSRGTRIATTWRVPTEGSHLHPWPRPPGTTVNPGWGGRSNPRVGCRAEPAPESRARWA